MKGSLIERKSDYDDASPSCQLPVCCELLLVSGERDTIVPHAYSVGFYQALLACPSSHKIHFLSLPNDDHFTITNSSSRSWAEIRDYICTCLLNE